MKRLKMLMPAAIAAVTFGLGAGAGSVWQMIINLTAPLSETETVQTIPLLAEISAPIPAMEPVTYADPVVVRSDDSKADAKPAENLFDATGTHYAYSEKLPKSFSKLEYISIEARDWDVDFDRFPNGKAIPPKGEIMIGKRFRFARIAIGDREIAFTTETIGGISYRFVGSFPGSAYCETSEDEDSPDLTGRLIRIRDGKWNAEANIDFYTSCGC